MSTAPPTWLCPAAGDRDRLLDMDARLKPMRIAALAVLAVALGSAAAVGSLGWWTLAPLAVATLAFSLAERGLASRARPEYAVAVAWLLTQLAIAASIALTGMVASPATAWLVLPVVTLPARFRLRGVTVGVAVTALLMVLCTAGLEPTVAAANPEDVVFPLALLLAVALLSVALMDSDLEHRTEAIVDPLTGMLNRGALRSRLLELTAQADVNGRSVAFVMVDVDHFKAINDEHGHAVGDIVLQEIAYRIRGHLRAYDLAYRLGGEEFLVVLPGADAEHAEHIAEGLRAAVCGSPMAGVECTVSCGVAVARAPCPNLDLTIAAADAALYVAKAAGRDRVMAADT